MSYESEALVFCFSLTRFKSGIGAHPSGWGNVLSIITISIVKGVILILVLHLKRSLQLDRNILVGSQITWNLLEAGKPGRLCLVLYHQETQLIQIQTPLPSGIGVHPSGPGNDFSIITIFRTGGLILILVLHRKVVEFDRYIFAESLITKKLMEYGSSLLGPGMSIIIISRTERLILFLDPVSQLILIELD